MVIRTKNKVTSPRTSPRASGRRTKHSKKSSTLEVPKTKRSEEFLAELTKLAIQHPANPDYIKFVSKEALVSVADINAKQLSQLTVKEQYGAFTCHYLFLTKNIVCIHHQANQLIGVGFIASKNSLYRELNRNVDWIFTNNALKISEICR